MWLGQKGESVAVNYLKQKGYRILKRNWRYRLNEIDIIACKQDVLVFVEVRGRKLGALQSGYDSIDKRKKERLLVAAKAYLRRLNPHPSFFRFDVVSIAWGESGACVCSHFENVPLFPKHFY